MARQEQQTNKGALSTSLNRDNTEIRKDRAETIEESAELAYRRKIEDTVAYLKDQKRKQTALLDLSPENTDSLILAKDFNPAEFVRVDSNIAQGIRNTELLLEILQSRYEFLFGVR